VSSCCWEALGVLRPGGRLVVEGAGLEAAVQDADEPLAELARGGSVAGAPGALAGWRAGTADPVAYDAPLAAARSSHGRLVGVDPSAVAVGSQVSVFAGLIAANLLGGHVLDRLLESVRAGQSRVLVLRGEWGVGKSALLEYLVGRASGCRVARAAGTPSEMVLAYADLHQLCAPVLDLRQRLPALQRGAGRSG
jgi:hypothetical protein